MATLDRSFIDDLLSRINIVEIIGKSVNLKKLGTSHKGLCPFHSENTPSFNVSETKQFYHCFGCGASGDVIKFLREHEGLSFIDAIEKLAGIANIEVPKNNTKFEDDTSNLINTNQIAHKYFLDSLSKSKTAKEYLSNRGIENSVIEKFEIGYAKESWDNLKIIIEKERKTKDAIDLGLLVNNKNKIYDRFRNRIMFPIKNSSGKVIAYGGRTIDKSEKAKYINSPESKLFYKSAEMYGIFESKQAISKEDMVIVVEGYTDVVSLHKHGFENTVASLGTALTKLHLKKLKRYSKNIVFCFDGDQAGRNAAWKALLNCLPEMTDETNIGFCFIEDNKDPDELCNENPHKFKNIIDNKIPLSDFIFNNVMQNLDLNKIEDKTKLTRIITPLIQQIPDGIYKKLLQEKLCSLTNLSIDELFSNNIKEETHKRESKNNYTIKLDTAILSILLEYPSLYEEFEKNIDNIIQDKNIGDMISLIPTLKTNNKYILNTFINMDNVKADLFIKCTSIKPIEKNINEARKTIKRILDEQSLAKEDLKFNKILEKWRKKEHLSEEEKSILKAGNKSKKV